MLETEESISKIDSQPICKKRPSCDRVLVRALAIWARKHAAKHKVSVNNFCSQFSNWRVRFEIHESVSETFLDIFCWSHWVTVSEFH